MSGGLSRSVFSRHDPSNPHRNFRLTKTVKEKMIGRTMPHGYVGAETKKKMLTIEKQISAAAGAGKKTFVDDHGVEHKITDEERYFAKEAREGGHTLARKSEVNEFARGEIQMNREFDVEMKSGLNIGSEREVAGKIVKEEEEGLAPEKPRYSAEDRRREFHQRTAEIRARIGLPGSSQSTGSMAPPPTIGAVKEVQPLAPGTSNAPASSKLTSAQHPAGLVSTPIVGGRHTDVDDTLPEPTVVAPTSDPIAEENQTAAESIPPPKDVELPDTSSVDKGLPF